MFTGAAELEILQRSCLSENKAGETLYVIINKKYWTLFDNFSPHVWEAKFENIQNN